jgi:hypothetical protein
MQTRKLFACVGVVRSQVLETLPRPNAPDTRCHYPLAGNAAGVS